MEIDETAARQATLGRNMTVIPADLLKHGCFPIVGGGHGGMSAFGGNGVP